jgi:hypothetical protein
MDKRPALGDNVSRQRSRSKPQPRSLRSSEASSDIAISVRHTTGKRKRVERSIFTPGDCQGSAYAFGDPSHHQDHVVWRKLADPLRQWRLPFRATPESLRLGEWVVEPEVIDRHKAEVIEVTAEGGEALEEVWASDEVRHGTPECLLRCLVELRVGLVEEGAACRWRLTYEEDADGLGQKPTA